MKALFIGRFQPFHKGHLKVIKKILEDFDEVIIGIGSSQYSDTFDNPFSGEERKKMIEESLNKEGIKNYEIFMIPDVHNPPNWVDHVLSIVPDFDSVVSNNEFTQKLFKKKGFNTKKTELFDKTIYSGKKIRNLIADGKKWEEFVPKSVSSMIYEINGVKRIKDLFK